MGTKTENLPPILDFNVTFEDRQALKELENLVIDLQVILPTLLNNLIGLQNQCKICCKMYCVKDRECDCASVIEEFDGYINRAYAYVQRAEALRDRAKCTTQLVSCTFSCVGSWQI